MPDFTTASMGTRLLAAVIALMVLAGMAAGTIVFSMMMVLFSADGSSAAEFDERVFQTIAYTVLGALAVAVLLPPVLMLCRVSAVYCAIPAGLGFIVAGLATMWYVMANLGAN